MKEIIRYQCDFCGKLAARPETIKKHEAVCIKNPEGKNCYMCEMAYIGDYEMYCAPSGSCYTMKDQCMCVYYDDVISSAIGDGNLAPRCDCFRRSEDIYTYRNREDAERNYGNLEEEK